MSPLARLCTLVVVLSFSLAATLTAQAASDPDWPTYGFNVGRTGDNRADSVTANNAASLKVHWAHHAGGSISAQPIVSNSLGLAFWGSWDGFEHATKLATGTDAWATALGTTHASSCSPSTVGVASTATLGALGTTPVVFVGGGNARFYALNATTGNIIWSTSLGSSPSHFLWSSPAVFNGSIYLGVASFGDCPLVQGQLVRLDASTGAIRAVFNVVPSTCPGGGVWGSPTVDPSNGFVYFTTGNPGACSSPFTEAVIKVFPNSLHIADAWQVRGPEHADLDFGTTPTLFTSGGVPMVGAGNKDGTYYALNRNAMKNGPVWRASIARGGGCPQCGSGVISPSAWDGSRLYIAGGHTSLNGVACAGSLSALTPSGGVIWRHCMGSGPVLGAVSLSGSPGVAFVGQGSYLMGIHTSDGKTLFRYQDTSSGSAFWGSPSISNGIVYMGNQDGNLYAFGF
jgi:polyvinyl alcohol dehydrogenase (cytochrome)